MTEQELRELIDKFNDSNEHRTLDAMKEKITFLDIFNKARRETIHSAIIAWILGCVDFNTLSQTPILLLLRLANKNDKKRVIDPVLSNLITTNKLHLSNISVDKEVATYNDKEGDGRVDIVVEADSNNGNGSKLRIVIENKIDSCEHDNQCKKYFDHFESSNLKSEFENVYIYLAPEKPKSLSCDHFIPITYQELLDEVLYPIAQYQTGYTDSALYLREYINTITSIREDRILAMNDECKILLLKFYRENSTLINALIDVACGDDTDKAAQTKSALKGGTKNYEVTLSQGATPITLLGHTKMAYEVAIELAKQLNSVTLHKQFGQLSGNYKNCQKDYILKTAKKSTKGGKYYTGNAITCTDGKKVWCSNQWIEEKVNVLIGAVKKYGITIQ